LYPHHLGHHIGLEVHDCAGISRVDKLKAGMCVTIEPYVNCVSLSVVLTSYSGIYVPDDERWPSHFRGMGVRIEDSICVRESDPYILTTEAAKEVRLTRGVYSRINKLMMNRLWTLKLCVIR